MGGAIGAILIYFLPGVLIGAFWGLAMFLGGTPGMLVSSLGAGRTLVRGLGSILSVAGQAYVSLAFSVFVIQFIQGIIAKRSPEVEHWPLWVVGWTVSAIPVWVFWKVLTQNQRESQIDPQEYQASEGYQRLMRETGVANSIASMVHGIGYILLAVNPVYIDPLWTWVPNW